LREREQHVCDTWENVVWLCVAAVASCITLTFEIIETNVFKKKWIKVFQRKFLQVGKKLIEKLFFCCTLRSHKGRVNKIKLFLHVCEYVGVKRDQHLTIFFPWSSHLHSHSLFFTHSLYSTHAREKNVRVRRNIMKICRLGKFICNMLRSITKMFLNSSDSKAYGERKARKEKMFSLHFTANRWSRSCDCTRAKGLKLIYLIEKKKKRKKNLFFVLKSEIYIKKIWVNRKTIERECELIDCDIFISRIREKKYFSCLNQKARKKEKL
jgi:hypothetical protein